MTGKNKCKILKDIRRQIAEKNNIDLLIKDCTFQGECKGTCPRCEAEVKYLEKELEKRRKLGQGVAIAGIVTLLAVNATGCKDNTKSFFEDTSNRKITEPFAESELMKAGEVPSPESTIGVTDTNLPPQESSVEPSAKIDFTHLLNLVDAEPTEYMSQYTREEIVSAWKQNQASTSVTEETFHFVVSGLDYYVTVTFDKNDNVIDVCIVHDDLYPIPETGMLQLQGDIIYLPDEE